MHQPFSDEEDRKNQATIDFIAYVPKFVYAYGLLHQDNIS